MKIEMFENSNFVQLGQTRERWKRQGRECLNEGANKELRYYFIHSTCVFGGKKYKEQKLREEDQSVVSHIHIF